MKQFCILLLIALLSACGTSTSVQPTPAPTNAPSVPIIAPTIPPTPLMVIVPPAVTITPTEMPTAAPAATTTASSATERIVFLREVAGNDQLTAIAPDGSSEVVLSASGEDVFNYAFSPDRRRIALVLSRGEIYDIALIASDGNGDARVIVRGQPSTYELAWSPDGQRLAFVVAPDGFANGANEDIYVVNADGTDLTQLTNDPLPEVAPVWSPDGQMIAFERGNYAPSLENDRQRVFVMRADGTNARPLTPPAFSSYGPSWSEDSQQVTLYAVGAPPHRYSVRADGSQLTDLGPLPAIYATPDSYQFVPAPDGPRIAFTRQHGECQVERCTRHIYVANGDDLRQLTQGDVTSNGDGLLNDHPLWSPDGARLVFRSNRDDDFALYAMNADGSDQRRLTKDAVSLGRVEWLVLPAAPITEPTR